MPQRTYYLFFLLGALVSCAAGDDDKILDLSQKARSGDPSAEFELANEFFEGKLIPKDEDQGMALLQRAALHGLPQAQFQMGERTYGDGTNAASFADA
jgi:TPR repeat protein